MTGGDRLIRWGATLCVLVVAGIAAVISYGHAYALVLANGESGQVAAVWPITIDGLIATCGLVVLDAARRGQGTPVLAWSLMACGVLATLGANVAHGLEHGWVGAVVAGWPALVATGCFELLTGMIRRSRESGRNAPSTRTSADLHSPPKVVATGPEPVSAIATVAQTDDPGPDLSNRHHGADPGLAPVVATARDHFAEVLARGDTPSVRAVRRELHLGHPRAAAVRAALAEE